MNTSRSKNVFVVLVAAGVLLGGQWALAGNLPTWGAATQPQPIQQPRPTIVSQPAANFAPSIQAPQPGTWTVPGTTSTPTVATPTQQPRSFRPKARSSVTPRAGFTSRTFNLQPKAVGRHLEQRASGYSPQLPAIAPVTVCSGYRQTPDTDRLTVPPAPRTYGPRSAPGADLHCTDLRGAFLENADLKGANLRGANLSGVHLRGTDFTGAFLEDADITGATLEMTNFTDARLNRTKLTNTKITGKGDGADFRGAIIDNVYLVASLNNAHFDGLDFSKLDTGPDGMHIKFSGATFTGTNFAGVSIGFFTDFSNAYMVRNSFKNASIQGATFTGANLSMADFSNATLHKVNFSNANLTGAKFTEMEGSAGFNYSTRRLAERGNSEINPELNFTGAIAMDADFTNAYLYSTEFNGTNLRRAVFNGAMLRKSVFTKNNLTGASFVGSAMEGSFLNGVNAEKAKFDSSKLARIFISGSNFKQASMLNVDMPYADITNSSFYQANLKQSNLISMGINSVDLRMANFQSSDLTGSLINPTTQFNGSNYSGSNLTRIGGCAISLHGYNHSYAPLTCPDGANRPLDLRSVNFSNAEFGNVSLHGSDFRNSNLSGSNLEINEGERFSYAGGEAHGYKLSGAIMPDGTAHP